MKIVKENYKSKVLENVTCKYIIKTGTGRYGASMVCVVFEDGSTPYFWLTQEKVAELKKFEEGNKYTIKCISYNGMRYISNVKLVSDKNNKGE